MHNVRKYPRFSMAWILLESGWKGLEYGSKLLRDGVEVGSMRLLLFRNGIDDDDAGGMGDCWDRWCCWYWSRLLLPRMKMMMDVDDSVVVEDRNDQDDVDDDDVIEWCRSCFIDDQVGWKLEQTKLDLFSLIFEMMLSSDEVVLLLKESVENLNKQSLIFFLIFEFSSQCFFFFSWIY